MAKDNTYRSLLDCWAPAVKTPGSEADTNPVPVAFMSTTFTFDAEFFEEECLTRFLVMETEKENDGVAFLIEREEKLAGLHGGIVLVDQVNCRGEKSLRWDLVPCRVKRGIMHSKITILQWSNCIRLIVGSANLTQQGCCINQEVFGVIDYVPQGDANLAVIAGALAQLKMIVSEQCGDIGKKRFSTFQSEINSTLRKWGITEISYKKDEVAIHLLPVSSKNGNALAKLIDLFSTYSSSPPDAIYITSPFFDKEDCSHTPSIKIGDVLRKRGKAHIVYNVTTEKQSEISNKTIVKAPGFLKNVPRSEISVEFNEVNEMGINEDNKPVPRPLHQKSIWLCNDDVHLYMIGSSNFTSAGLGLGKWINYEANLVYIISQSRNKKALDLLLQSYIKTTELDEAVLQFEYRSNEDEENENNEMSLLPGCFGEAVIKKSGEQYILELNFNNDKIPSGFKIHNEVKERDGSIHFIFNEAHWFQSGKILKIQLEWAQSKIPNFLMVSWDGSKSEAFWPVLVENQVTLPPVDCLRDLSLEALLQILSSNQPLHRLLQRIEKLKGKSVAGIDEVVDPHKLVNTSGYLLQRTRRVAYGIKSLRERIEKPVFTRESLIWRIYGPIGVNALVDGIRRESRSNDEKQFLLAELALELSRVNPKTTEFSIKAKDVMLAVKEVIEKLNASFSFDDNPHDNSIHNYSQKAFQKAIHAL